MVGAAVGNIIPADMSDHIATFVHIPVAMGVAQRLARYSGSKSRLAASRFVAARLGACCMFHTNSNPQAAGMMPRKITRIATRLR
jgi:hypothetical protein